MPEIKISLFKPGRNGKPGLKPIPTDFYSEMNKIQDGTHYAVIKELRSLVAEPEKYTDFKTSKLESFTISASCDKKRETKNATASGLMCIDLDPKANPDISDWPAVRDMLFEMPEVVSAFLSASGRGVAFVFKINPLQFKDVFYSVKDELSDNFGLELDKGCHDIVRLRFISHDHDLKIRSNYEEIPVKEPSSVYLEKKRTKIEKASEYSNEIDTPNCDRAWGYAVKSAETRTGFFADGNVHNYLVRLAGFCNTIGMDSGYCTGRACNELLSLGTKATAAYIEKTINAVYKTYSSKFNTYVQTVESRRLNNSIRGYITKEYLHKGIKPDAEILGAVAEKLEANIERVEEITERVFDEYKSEFNSEELQKGEGVAPYWFTDEDENLVISKFKFRDYLVKKGVFRYRIEKKWILILLENNIVSEIQKADLKQIVMSELERLKEFQVWELLANRVTSVFADDFLELLPIKEIKFYRDKEKSICLFYQNGIIEIVADSYKLVAWKDFKGYIWKDQVLQRDVSVLDYDSQKVKSDYEKYIWNISGKNSKRFLSIMTSLGYLIHLYKNKGKMPAVIVNDEVISDQPQGGTGKGMLIETVEHFRNVVTIDAKLFDFQDKFRYQQINLDTAVVFFDDTPKGFKFEKLFSSMTSGFQIEKKSGLKFHIPFINSPKVAITTNYAIEGNSVSFRRRKHELELSPYYHDEFTPFIEFKKQLITDFTPAEMNMFDNFIFNCCQQYLSVGLVKQDLINQPLKQLISSTSKEFVSFMDEEHPATLEMYRLNQADVYREFQGLYPSRLSAKVFYDFMVLYYTYHGGNFRRAKVGGERCFIIGKGA